jgi:GntR family transcriptional regulator/MocR family aminotransferase
MKNDLPIDAIKLNSQSSTPLYRQLYTHIRKAIINKQFPANIKLPSTRQLASELNISRSTVTATYDQLIAEGYLISKQGSGTRVAKILIKEHTNNAQNNADNISKQHSVETSELSTMAQYYYERSHQKRVRTNYQQTTLMPGIPSRHNFPNAVWGKILGKYAKQSLTLDAGYDHPSGVPQIKTAIADYIRLARGVNTKAEDVLVVTSTQAALDLLCRTLLDKNDNAWIEEPGYGGANIAMRNAGANIHGIPVDLEGITIPSGKPLPKLIYTSPSHQYPTGVTMSYSRRMALLNFANQHKSWIMEDDYDSEFRYRGNPLPCLQGLDNNQRVIYIGTFSKSLSPSMRVAYIVSPPALSPLLKNLLADTGAGVNIGIQYALAEFIQQGHYSLHIRRARKEYAEKQTILNQSIQIHLSDMVDFSPSNAGLQATLTFKRTAFKQHFLDTALVQLA